MSDVSKQLPKVKCQLAGQDSNAFAILGRFQTATRRAGWDKADIDKVIREATSSDYDNLITTIMRYCE